MNVNFNIVNAYSSKSLYAEFTQVTKKLGKNEVIDNLVSSVLSELDLPDTAEVVILSKKFTPLKNNSNKDQDSILINSEYPEVEVIIFPKSRRVYMAEMEKEPVDTKLKDCLEILNKPRKNLDTFFKKLSELTKEDCDSIDTLEVILFALEKNVNLNDKKEVLKLLNSINKNYSPVNMYILSRLVEKFENKLPDIAKNFYPTSDLDPRNKKLQLREGGLKKLFKEYSEKLNSKINYDVIKLGDLDDKLLEFIKNPDSNKLALAINTSDLTGSKEGSSLPDSDIGHFSPLYIEKKGDRLALFISDAVSMENDYLIIDKINSFDFSNIDLYLIPIERQVDSYACSIFTFRDILEISADEEILNSAQNLEPIKINFNFNSENKTLEYKPVITPAFFKGTQYMSNLRKNQELSKSSVKGDQNLLQYIENKYYYSAPDPVSRRIDFWFFIKIQNNENITQRPFAPGIKKENKFIDSKMSKYVSRILIRDIKEKWKE